MITRENEYGELDWDELREDLLDHYGADVIFDPALPVSMIDVPHADEDELAKLAEQAGLDLEDYRE